MKRKYVPILKCKMGEQKALLNLADDVKESIIPIIEFPAFSEAMIKKGMTVEKLISTFWEKRKYFFYFTPDWYNDYDEFEDFLDAIVIPLCNNEYGIPVIDLNLVSLINDWSKLTRNGIAIRLRNNEFGQVEEILNPIFKNANIKRSQTHLIFDLQYVSENELFSKTAVLKSAFSDLDKASEFASVIISSVSFPKQFTQLESNNIYRFRRTELDILNTALRLAKRFNFNYCYSDYGPSDIEDNAYVLGMSPNFKIKYTSMEDYLFIKGIQVKKGGLDISNVRLSASILIESNDFLGESYSWGDKCIYDLAKGISQGAGNLTTWVSYAMNHHITVIVNQI